MIKKRIHILHLIHKLTVGGAERVLANIVNSGHDRFRHVICSFCTPDDFCKTINDQVTLVSLNKQEGNDFRIPFRLAKLCRQYEIDLIHSIGWSTYLDGFLGGLLRLNKKPRFVYAFHGKTIEDLARMPQRRIWAQRLLANGCDAIIAPSLEMKRDYAQTFGIEQGRIRLIYNGVDEKLFSPVDAFNQAKTDFGFTADDVVFGCIARLDPVKNLPALIRGFALVQKTAPQAKLMIVGGGQQHDELLKLVADLQLQNSVLLTGERSDIEHCLRGMDVYVLPSFYEGFSVTILEAMAAGLPIVAGRVGGTPELVQNGRNGYLFDLSRSHENELSRLMGQLGEDRLLRERMGRQSRKLVAQQFTLAGMVQNYETLFSELVLGHHKGMSKQCVE